MCATALAYQVAGKDNLKYFAQEEHFIGVELEPIYLSFNDNKCEFHEQCSLNIKLVADN